MAICLAQAWPRPLRLGWADLSLSRAKVANHLIFHLAAARPLSYPARAAFARLALSDRTPHAPLVLSAGEMGWGTASLPAGKEIKQQGT